MTYITNDFHSYRAGELAKKSGLNANSLTAGIEYYLMPSVYSREVLAVLKLWVFGE